MAPGRNPSIVPDASIHVALPDVVTQRGATRGSAHAARRHLFDVKTIHAGTTYYYAPQAVTQLQSEAVHSRELQVLSDYTHHAREMDRLFSPPGQQPILQRLRSFGRTRGLVFGAYGERRVQRVHALITHAA